MKKNFISVFLIFFCSLITFGQDKPGWMTSFENKIKQQEADWKLEKIDGLHSQNGHYDYVFYLASKTHRAFIRINKLADGLNRREKAFEEIFLKEVAVTDKGMDKNAGKMKLENFGNEGFIWTNFNKAGRAIIKFRKYDVFVMISSPSEEETRKFAQYVVDEMP